MKILVMSDEESRVLSNFYTENKFDDISFILSAGDLSYTYLQTIKSNLNKPLFYVRGTVFSRKGRSLRAEQCRLRSNS